MDNTIKVITEGIKTPNRQLAIKAFNELFEAQGIDRGLLGDVVSILEGKANESVVSDLDYAAKTYPEVYKNWRKLTSEGMLKLFLEWNSLIGYEPLIINRWKNPKKYMDDNENIIYTYHISFHLARETIELIELYGHIRPTRIELGGNVIYETNSEEEAIIIARLIQDYANIKAFGGIYASDEEMLNQLKIVDIKQGVLSELENKGE